MVRRFWSNNDFDSVLFYPNQRNISTMSLLVRVHLNPFNPSGAATKEEHFFDEDDDDPAGGTMYTFQRWNPAEWEIFKTEYKRDVESYLNWPRMGLWLRPDSLGLPDSQDELNEFMHPHPISPRFRAFVQCSLSVTVVPKKEESHVSFDVLRLKDDQPDFRSYDVNDRNARDTGILTHRDIQRWALPSGDGISQSTVAHELGHALNLDHSNINDPACVHGNEDICYGKPGTPERRNLMGVGNEVTTANALPWLRAAYRHTQSLVWDATTDMPREMHFLR